MAEISYVVVAVHHNRLLNVGITHCAICIHRRRVKLEQDGRVEEERGDEIKKGGKKEVQDGGEKTRVGSDVIGYSKISRWIHLCIVILHSNSGYTLLYLAAITNPLTG